MIFDLEDGCRKKELSRELLKLELPGLRQSRPDVQIAIRINPFRTVEFERDITLLKVISDEADVVMLAKAGEAYGSAEVRDLSSILLDLNTKITIQPII